MVCCRLMTCEELCHTAGLNQGYVLLGGLGCCGRVCRCQGIQADDVAEEHHLLAAASLKARW